MFIMKLGWRGWTIPLRSAILIVVAPTRRVTSEDVEWFFKGERPIRKRNFNSGCIQRTLHSGYHLIARRSYFNRL
jgi:hypothetical protein